MSRRGNCYDNAVMESFFSTREERAQRIASTAAAKRRWSCSTTSRCSTTSVAGTRRSARSARQRSRGVGDSGGTRELTVYAESGQCHPPKKCASTSPDASRRPTACPRSLVCGDGDRTNWTTCCRTCAAVVFQARRGSAPLSPQARKTGEHACDRGTPISKHKSTKTHRG